MISGHALCAGVMGWPVSHSLSPRIHNYWLQKEALDGAYIPLAVHPQRLEQAIRALPALGFRGCNLTIPHKENALGCVDLIDPVAKRIGSINTIVVGHQGDLEGFNTDCSGFQSNLRQAGFALTSNKTAVVLGAGGAARAVIAALQEMGHQEIRLINRSQDRAEKCAQSFSDKTIMRVFPWTKAQEALDGAGLLVNTTSLGMQGQPELVLNIDPLAPSAWVTDIVYTPLMTGLLKQAQEKNRRYVDGLGMLLYQAIPGFTAWFGRAPHVTDELRRIVLAHD